MENKHRHIKMSIVDLKFSRGKIPYFIVMMVIFVEKAQIFMLFYSTTTFASHSTTKNLKIKSGTLQIF